MTPRPINVRAQGCCCSCRGVRICQMGRIVSLDAQPVSMSRSNPEINCLSAPVAGQRRWRVTSALTRKQMTSGMGYLLEEL